MPPSLKEHLDPGTGPKRVLALDGGGTLGIIEVAFLERIEDLLRERHGGSDSFRLCHYFDLIGGTSTGALIATALALGMRASEVKALYFDFARKIFRRPLFGLPFLDPQFSASGLNKVLDKMLGDRKLESADLQTGLALLLKRVDTGSPWVLTNNPRNMFWDDPPNDPVTNKRPHIGNRHYRLKDILRASTAAPYYFAPHTINVVPSEPPGLFVDGSVSPHNNPALMLLMMTGIDGYRLGWTLDKDALLLVSIGAGAVRPELPVEDGRRMSAVGLAKHALQSVIWDGQMHALKTLQWVSATRKPWPIDMEVGALGRERLTSDPFAQRTLATFQRYDVMLDAAWIAAEADVKMSKAAAKRLNDFVNPAIMKDAYEIASKAAAKQVQSEDFPQQFNLVRAI